MPRDFVVINTRVPKATATILAKKAKALGIRRGDYARAVLEEYAAEPLSTPPYTIVGNQQRNDELTPFRDWLVTQGYKLSTAVTTSAVLRRAVKALGKVITNIALIELGAWAAAAEGREAHNRKFAVRLFEAYRAAK